MTQTLYSSNQEASAKANLELNSLADNSQRTVFRCHTVFPFTLFPDTIVVDQNKVDIIYGKLFFSLG